MLRFVAMADIHFDLFKSQAPIGIDRLSTRSHDLRRACEEVIRYCVKHSIKTVIVAGDIFEIRDVIPVPLFNLVYETLRKFSQAGITLHVIHGNHDQVTKGGITHSLIPMQDIAEVYSEPTVRNIDGYDFCMVPFKERDGVAKDVELLLTNMPNSATPCFLISHVGIKGAFYNTSSVQSTAPTTIESLRPDLFTGIFLGDYHNHQQLCENAWYVGAPVQHDFGDVGAKRGFLDVTYDKDLEVKFVELEGYPQFHYVEADKYVSGSLPKADKVSLIGATRKQRKKFQADTQVVGVKNTAPPKHHSRIELGMDESWDDSVDKYIDYMAKEPQFKFNVKEAKDLGKATLAKVCTHKPKRVGTDPVKISLKARNFMAFGKEGVEIDFSKPGMFLVTGVNESSSCKTGNGTGKSSLFKALVYGLYGLGRKITKSNIPNLETKKDCEVEVTVAFPDGRVASIIRRIKVEGFTDGIYLTVDGADNRGNKDSETQEIIVSLLGMTKEAFKTTVYCGSDDSDDNYASQGATGQYGIISEILSLQDVSAALEEIKDDAKAVKKGLLALEQKTAIRKDRVEQLSTQVETERQSVALWETAHKQNIAQKQTLLTRLQDARKLSVQKSEAKQVTRDQLSTRIVTINKQLEELNVDVALEELKSLNRTWATDSGDLRIASFKVAENTKTCGSLRQLHGVATCTHCLSEITEAHRLSVLTKAVEEGKGLDTQQKSLQEALNQLQVKIRTTTEQVNAGNALSGERDRVNNSIRLIETEIASLLREVTSYFDQAVQLKTDIQADKAMKAPNSSSLDALTDKILDNMDDLEDLEEETEVQEDKLALLEFWVVGFGKAGLANFLIEGILPELNKLTTKYSDLLTNGETSVIFQNQKTTQTRGVKNDLNLKIDDLYGSEDYATSSGGEKRRINMITNLALFGLISQRNNMGFSVLDEIFVHMDSAGEEFTLNLLNKISADIGTMFLISNKDSIVANDFDGVLEIHRKGRSSRLEVIGA